MQSPGMGTIPVGPIVACLYNYFSFLCNFVLLETICVKLAMDMWGWGAQQAISNMGWMMMGAGACTLVVFCLIGPLSKRYLLPKKSVQNQANDSSGLTNASYCFFLESSP